MNTTTMGRDELIQAIGVLEKDNESLRQGNQEYDESNTRLALRLDDLQRERDAYVELMTPLINDRNTMRDTLTRAQACGTDVMLFRQAVCQLLRAVGHDELAKQVFELRTPG